MPLEAPYKKFLVPYLLNDERLADVFLQLFLLVGLTPVGWILVEQGKLIGTLSIEDATAEVSWQSTLALTGVTDLAHAATRLRHGSPGVLPFEQLTVQNDQGCLLLSHAAPDDTDLILTSNGVRIEADDATTLQLMLAAATPK